MLPLVEVIEVAVPSCSRSHMISNSDGFLSVPKNAFAASATGVFIKSPKVPPVVMSPVASRVAPPATTLALIFWSARFPIASVSPLMSGKRLPSPLTKPSSSLTLADVVGVKLIASAFSVVLPPIMLKAPVALMALPALRFTPPCAAYAMLTREFKLRSLPALRVTVVLLFSLPASRAATS